MPIRRLFFIAAATILVGLTGQACAGTPVAGGGTAPGGEGSTGAADGPRAGREGAARPESWARPVPGKPGLPNLYKVTDSLYRGAQPEDKGFHELEKMGIKTVVNLRSFLSSDRDECREVGLDYEHITVQTWETEDEEVLDFLRIAADPARQPVFVHCRRGADRTGLMVAAYRIVVQGWSKDDAIREMTEGGFDFHPIWQNIVSFLRDLDVERFRGLLED